MMAKPHQQMTDYKRRHALAVSKAMKASAEARRCPKCERGNALVKRETDKFTGPIYVCRYCPYSS